MLAAPDADRQVHVPAAERGNRISLGAALDGQLPTAVQQTDLSEFASLQIPSPVSP